MLTTQYDSSADRLKHLQQESERNFARLKILDASLFENGEYDRLFKAGSNGNLTLRLRVIEVSAYTRVLSLSGSMGLSPLLKQQSMNVRVYQDVKMAEVISCGEDRVRLLRYPFPNKNMFCANEKNELNQFLGQWLEHFILHADSST